MKGVWRHSCYWLLSSKDSSCFQVWNMEKKLKWNQFTFTSAKLVDILILIFFIVLAVPCNFVCFWNTCMLHVKNICLGNCSCYQPKGGENPGAAASSSGCVICLLQGLSLSASDHKAPSPCLLCVVFVGKREGVNVASLRWAALSAQRQTGDWCGSQWQSWALHCAGKLKGKRLPASISCREQRGREGASSSPAVAAVGFLSQEVQPSPSSLSALPERARHGGSWLKVHHQTVLSFLVCVSESYQCF